MSEAITVENVSMLFNMSKEKISSVKEYFIKLVKRQLRYEEFTALNNVSFSVEKGDVFGIVGLNGSGKSTLLKIISGIIKPSSGSVTVSGAIAPLIELGAGFDMELTARENIYLNGSVLGHSKKFLDEHFDEIVDFSEMREFLDVPMKNYSSGMVARVGFAIATMTKPDILIVDEILGVGDFKFQEKCEKRINDMMSGGTTVLIVSHSIQQIERLCNHAVWLERGNVKMCGEVDDVCAAYMGKPRPNRKVVYTTIFGGYDTLKTPQYATEGWDYICFTDDKRMESDFWHIVYVDAEFCEKYEITGIDNPWRLSKFFKMHPHLLFPKHRESIWVAENLHIIGDLNDWIDRYSKSSDMICFIHPDRDCIYEEAEVCVNAGLALKDESDIQMSKYWKEGLPEHFGLIASGILYRKHTGKVLELDKLWYRENRSDTSSDQMVFNYCCWKLNFNYDKCSLNYWDNPWFKWEDSVSGSNIVTARLYIQTDSSPFSEETVIVSTLGFPYNRFDVIFDFGAIRQGIRYLRFDPAEAAVKIKIDRATLLDAQGMEYTIIPENSNAGTIDGEWMVFSTNDPNIYYKIQCDDLESARFSGEIVVFNE